MKLLFGLALLVGLSGCETLNDSAWDHANFSGVNNAFSSPSQPQADNSSSRTCRYENLGDGYVKERCN